MGVGRGPGPLRNAAIGSPGCGHPDKAGPAARVSSARPNVACPACIARSASRRPASACGLTAAATAAITSARSPNGSKSIRKNCASWDRKAYFCARSSLHRAQKRLVLACPVLYRSGAPGTIRTSDPQIRSLVLYPAELRARFSLFISGLTVRLQSQRNSGAKAPPSYRLRGGLARSGRWHLPIVLRRKGRTEKRSKALLLESPRRPQSLRHSGTRLRREPRIHMDSGLIALRNTGDGPMFTPSPARCGWSAVPPAGRG